MGQKKEENHQLKITKKIDFAQIFSVLPDPYLLLQPNPTLTIIAVNKSYLDKIFTRKNILGLGLFEVVSDKASSNDLKQSLNRVIEEGVQDVTKVIKCKISLENEDDFEEKECRYINTPVFDKENNLVAILLRIEEVTNQQSYDANNKTGNREKELSELNKRLEELDIVKTKFFSNISHEFRTPLTLMLGPLEEALSESTEAKPKLWHAQLEVVYRNSLRLLRLVNNLLDFSNIEAGRINASYQPTDLAEFTNNLASMFISALHKAKLKFTINCPPLDKPVYVDREMWEKIVLNLVSNAFKYTFEGEIEIKLVNYTDHVELKVRDTGVGIPFDQLPTIFEKFSRLPNVRSRTYEESGIALALVKELVNLHGGTIRVSSVEDEGSTFTVSIPFGKDHLPKDKIKEDANICHSLGGRKPILDEALHWVSDEEVSKKEAANSVNGQTQNVPHILFVDDDEGMQKYVSTILAPFCDLRIAADGVLGLEAALSDPPDLILSDIMMPNMNGTEFLSKAKTHPKLKSIPFILLSAQAGEEAKLEGLQLGADDYLVKPFKAKELLARIKVNLNLEIQHTMKMAEEALDISEKRFQSVFNQPTVGIAQVDLTGKFILANSAYCQMTGRSEHELYQLSIYDIIQPEDLTSKAQFIDNIIESNSPLSIKMHFVKPDKTQSLAQFHISLVKDSQNHPRFLMMVSQKI